MANPDQIKILELGVEAWNRWRETFPLTYRLDLSESNISNADLRGINLMNVDLQHSNLREVNLAGAQLTGASLSGSDLTKANLSHARLNAASCVKSIFVESDLYNAQIHKTNLAEANLRQAKIMRVDFTGSFLEGANLMRAAIYKADFSYARLKDATFEYATLHLVNLRAANLRGVKFNEALIREVSFDDNDLSQVISLQTVLHSGPSSIGIDTIYKSAGDIPQEFLRGCGVPEDFITYMRSLTSRAIEVYSCFISYSSKDEEFARRLHSDLQSEGVRCWFASEDLKIGDRFRVRIDESIRLYDKLLLVLSENSVASEWVGDEVETALEKEDRQGGEVVLFPLRLDGAVMEIDSGWPAKVRRTRHIGDFREWKNHDSYRKAFDRLMRDLKAGASG